MTLRPQWTALKNDRHIVLPIRQIRIHRHQPRAAKTFGRRQIHRCFCMHFWQCPPHKVDIERPPGTHGIQPARSRILFRFLRVHIHIPLPIWIACLSRQRAHQTAILIRRPRRRQITHATSARTRRLKIHRKIASACKIRFAIRIDPHCCLHDICPPRKALNITIPVLQSLVPAAILIAPRGIHGTKHIHCKPHPLLRFGNLIQKRHANLTQKMPGTTGMATIRMPQIAHLSRQMIVHLLPLHLHHRAAYFAFFFA